jgi:hypothetical protein
MLATRLPGAGGIISVMVVPIVTLNGSLEMPAQSGVDGQMIRVPYPVAGEIVAG